MKTVLRTLLFTLAIFLTQQQLQAQCTISDIVIQNVSISGVPNPGTCTVTFDASFTLENNNGNKYIFIHAWLQQDYPNYFDCVNGQTTRNGAIHAPDQSDLADAFMTIGINNNDPAPSIITTYPPDNSVPMTTINSISRTVGPDGEGFFILQGITVTVPVTCGTPVVIIADLWSSQSAAAQVAHCVNCGIMSGSGFLRINGFVNCATLMYNASISNNTGATVTGNYKVYVDINADGYFTTGLDTMIQNTTNFTVNGSSSITVSGPIPPANRNQDLFLVTTITSGPGTGGSRVALLPSTVCSPLPVTFQSFKATRINSSTVSLKWETASEINNSGFAVLRSTGGNWEFVSFIPTQALGGNSNSNLVYHFTDMNSYKGMSQYRIRQTDIDGKVKYTDIRAVRGDAQLNKVIVYPNPSTDGRVMIVFDDRDGICDLTLVDNNGRAIRQWKALSGNTVQVDDLGPGMFTLRIVVRETGMQQVEKILVIR